MRLIRGAVAVVASAVLVATCSTPGRTDPATFTVEYQTGSIPPPFNYAYTVSGIVRDAGIDVVYDLVYQFREGVTDEELSAQGYGPDDDLHWEGRLTGAEAERWITLLGRTRVAAPPSPLPGGDSFTVGIGFADGGEQTGAPEQRSEWEALLDALDVQARAETGHTRPGR